MSKKSQRENTKPATKLRVVRATIKNILGIDELDFEPGNVTILSGSNGSGKTSALEAIRNIVHGGHDATLLKNGEDKGETVLVFNDGTKLTKTIKQDRSTVLAQTPDGGKINSPQTFVDELVDTFSWNPIAFLTAPKKKRVQTLLEMTPFEVHESDLVDIAKHCTAKYAYNPAEPLAYLDTIRKDIFDKRTGVNRTLKDKTATAKEIRHGLPPATETLSAIDGRISDIDLLINDVTAATASAVDNLRSCVSTAEAQAKDKIHALEMSANERILQIRQELDTQKTKIQSALYVTKEALNGKIHDEQASSEDSIAAEREELAKLHQRRDDINRSAGSRKLAEKLEKESRTHEIEAEQLTTALADIDAYKINIMKQLPLKGVEIRDDDIYINGVPFDRVNEAAKVKVAIQLAELRCQKTALPLICVDGLERMDEFTFSAFIEEAAKTDIQFIVSRVTEDTELTISTSE